MEISHYRIFEEVGRGGMGVVYRAEDLKLHRVVALKFFPEDLSVTEETVARFQREGEALAALNHPNIATMYDCDEADGKKFLAFEYLPGGTLRSKIKGLIAEARQFTVGEVLEYGIRSFTGTSRVTISC
jgi:serine/threonine protein kinase